MKSVNAVTIKELYDLSHTEAKPLMEQYTYPWEVLPHIGEFIVKLGESLPKEEYTEVAEQSGCIRQRRYLHQHIWQDRQSSAPRQKCASVRLSAEMLWLEKAV